MTLTIHLLWSSEPYYLHGLLKVYYSHTGFQRLSVMCNYSYSNHKTSSQQFNVTSGSTWSMPLQGAIANPLVQLANSWKIYSTFNFLQNSLLHKSFSRVCASYCQHIKNGQYPRGFMKNRTKSCQVDKITFHFQAQITKQMLWSCGFFHEKELAAVRGFLAWPEEPVKHHALGSQQFGSQLSDLVSTWLKTLSIFSASHRPDPDTRFGWQSSEYFCLFS